MINIRDIYISIKDIKTVRFRESFDDQIKDALVISYFYDQDNDVVIDVDHFGEYRELAEQIKRAVNEWNVNGSIE